MELPNVSISLEEATKQLSSSKPVEPKRFLPIGVPKNLNVVLPGLNGLALINQPYHQPLFEPTLAQKRSTERLTHLSEVLPVSENIETILDIGAGNCEITNEIARIYQSTTAYACDVYPADQFVPPSQDTKVIYCQIEDGHIPVGKSSVDLVTAFMAIHHIDKMNETVKDIRHVLKLNRYIFLENMI